MWHALTIVELASLIIGTKRACVTTLDLGLISHLVKKVGGDINPLVAYAVDVWRMYPRKMCAVGESHLCSAAVGIGNNS